MDTITCIQRAVDFIEENLCGSLDCEDIAARAYMSDFHFRRLFAVVSGVTLGEYIRGRRLTLAGLEVQSSDRKIIDIALDYGYESPESFSRAFTRFHGASPMAVRSRQSDVKSTGVLSVKSILGGNQMIRNLKERGYTVKENGSVYFTKNMDKTARWFEDILGWYSGIDARDENGDGTYGCVLPFPDEIKEMTCTPFNGFHLFYGEPMSGVVAFINVDNVEKLHDFITGNGWTQISGITEQPWGARECSVTTIDGGVMRFFQTE